MRLSDLSERRLIILIVSMLTALLAALFAADLAWCRLTTKGQSGGSDPCGSSSSNLDKATSGTIGLMMGLLAKGSSDTAPNPGQPGNQVAPGRRRRKQSATVEQEESEQ